MKESTSALSETTTLHHEEKPNALPKTTLHCEGNLMHASLLSIVKENTTTSILYREGKYKHNQKCIANNYIALCVSFPYSTSTSALPKTTLHREGNLMRASFPSIVKKITKTSLFQQLHSIMKESTSALPKTTLHYEQKIRHSSFPS
jgi:hypothetical protein